jgi:hypothetical protein
MDSSRPHSLKHLSSAALRKAVTSRAGLRISLAEAKRWLVGEVRNMKFAALDDQL